MQHVQEAHSYKIAVRPERRRSFQSELQDSASSALDILTSCLGQPGDRTRAQVRRAWACTEMYGQALIHTH